MSSESELPFDYVIVGGGSSGCVAAGVLSEDPGVRVLLLECGAPAEANPETLAAEGYKQAFINDEVIWDRFSEPQPACGKQRLFMGSGTGMGGSGAVNAMVYTRGCRLDFEEWPRGWKWDDCVPHFEAVEAKLRPRRREPTGFSEVCVEAAVEAGLRHAEDLNDGDMSEVLGYEWMNFEGDRRRHSYVAFVGEAPRPNLEVRTHARVQRVRLDDARRVTGVEYVDGEGQSRRVEVTREVLMCAGALETPKLMMLSGIGPGEALRAVGLELVHELPELGQNLHDHPNVSLFFRGDRYVDFFHPQLYGFTRANPASTLPPGQSDTCIVFYGGNSSLYEASKRMIPYKLFGGPRYGPVKRELSRAMVELAFKLGARRFVERVYGIVVILGKPRSRGRLSLRSDRAEDCARLDPGYFSDPEDMQTMIAGVRKARAIAATRALSEWGNRELLPGARKHGDAAIQRFIERNAMTTFHYAGTCRMGEDAGAVVDTRGRVAGVRGLRVADASITPWTPVSAMNAPSMMIGHRVASFAREEAREGAR